MKMVSNIYIEHQSLPYKIHSQFHMVFTKRQNHNHYLKKNYKCIRPDDMLLCMYVNLYVHFDESFSNESSSKECPEWNEKMATCDAS